MQHFFLIQIPNIVLKCLISKILTIIIVFLINWASHLRGIWHINKEQYMYIEYVSFSWKWSTRKRVISHDKKSTSDEEKEIVERNSKKWKGRRVIALGTRRMIKR